MYTEISRGKKGEPNDYAVFVCDTASDIAKLPTTKRASLDGQHKPCFVASKAVVIEEDATYVLNHSDKWIKCSALNDGIGGGSGGGSGSSTDKDNPLIGDDLSDWR